MNRLTLTTIAAGFCTPILAGAIVPPIPQLPIAALKQAAMSAPNTPMDAPTDSADAKPEDPAAIADRIAQNTRDAGDRLASADSGDQTRHTQDAILKDIDKLLKLADNPPPSVGGGSGTPPPSSSPSPPMPGGDPSGGQSNTGGQKPQQPMNSDSSQPNGRQSQSNPGSSGASSQPMGSRDKQTSSRSQRSKSSGWRDRQARKEPGSQPDSPEPASPGGTQTAGKPPSQPMPGQPMPGQPMPGAGPKAPVAQGPGPKASSGTGRPGDAKSASALPFDDPYTKEVWGHLPEQMRQKMTQYYREQFVSKYGDLLRQYYSSLAEREKSGGKR